MSKNKFTLLIIDKEIDDFKSFEKKYKIIYAEDGQSGLDTIMAHHLDCVLLHIRIPKKDSLSVLLEVKKTLPTLPIIIMAGDGDEEQTINAIHDGAIGFMRKPLDMDAVEDLIDYSIQSAKLREAANEKPTLLFVDDEEPIRKSVSKALKFLPLKIHSLENGEDALNFIKNNHVDVLITDIRMPKLNGIQLLKHINNMDTDMLRIVVTGHGDYNTAITALKYGAFGYIKKPINLDELNFTIQKGIDRQSKSRHLEISLRDLKQKQRMLEEAFQNLKEAKQEINRLQGLLPICTYCKKVRDDGDYWHEVEHYIHDNTDDVNFSHSICPDCMEIEIKPQLEGKG